MARRFAAWVAGSFVLALFAATLLPRAALLLIACCGAAGAALFLFLRFPFRQTVSACLLAVALASGLFLWDSAACFHRRDTLAHGTHSVEGEVLAVSSNSARTLRCYTLRLRTADGAKVPGVLRFGVSLYTELDASVGDLLQTELTFFEGDVSFGAGLEDRVFLSAYQEAGNIIHIVRPNALRARFDRLKQATRARISFGSADTNGLLRAICFGDRASIASDLAVSFKRIGLSHVMAVSGLHLSFAVMLLQFILLLCGVGYRVRYAVSAVAGVLFTALAGFPPSCVRACIMLLLFSLAMALNLFPDSVTALAVAALLITLVNPFSVRDIGFQLSAAATAGILFLRVPIEYFLFPKKISSRHVVNGIYRAITGLLACSLAASAATLPFVLWYFGAVSLIAPLSNLLLIYPLQLLFVLGILTVLLGGIPGVGFLLGKVCDFIYTAVSGAAFRLGRIPFASVSVLSGRGLYILILLTAVLLVSGYQFFRFHRRRTLALFAALLCFTAAFYALSGAFRQESGVEIAFVDMGQGDCTVLTRDGSAVIIDCGGSSQKRPRLISYLRSKNVRNVELLAFTDMSEEHTNGIYTLMNQYYIDRLYCQYWAAGRGELHRVVQALGGVRPARATVLGDVVIEPIEQIDSFSYRITCDGVSLLIAAETSMLEERESIEDMEDCTILRVAAHGSNRQSLYSYLKSVSPEIAVISCGEGAYGAADEAVVERLSTLCREVRITRDEGTIRYLARENYLERIEG